MNNKEFARKLEERTRHFAVQIINFSSRLPNSPEGRAIRTQLVRSGTSVGANYREANRARSKPDFRNRMKICEGECSETQYWLEVLVDAGMLASEDTKTVYDECSELLAIFTSASSSLNR